MKAFLTSTEDEKFFFNSKYLKEFVSAASLSKKFYPGHNYFEKIADLWSAMLALVKCTCSIVRESVWKRQPIIVNFVKVQI